MALILLAARVAAIAACSATVDDGAPMPPGISRTAQSSVVVTDLIALSGIAKPDMPGLQAHNFGAALGLALVDTIRGQAGLSGSPAVHYFSVQPVRVPRGVTEGIPDARKPMQLQVTYLSANEAAEQVAAMGQAAPTSPGVANALFALEIGRDGVFKRLVLGMDQPGPTYVRYVDHLVRSSRAVVDEVANAGPRPGLEREVSVKQWADYASQSPEARAARLTTRMLLGRMLGSVDHGDAPHSAHGEMSAQTDFERATFDLLRFTLAPWLNSDTYRAVMRSSEPFELVADRDAFANLLAAASSSGD